VIKRLAAVWHARNLEFVRDRSTLFSRCCCHCARGGHEFRVRGPGAPAFQGRGQLRQSSTNRPTRS